MRKRKGTVFIQLVLVTFNLFSLLVLHGAAIACTRTDLTSAESDDGGSEITRVKLMKYARELKMEEEGQKGQKLASIKRDILPCLLQSSLVFSNLAIHLKTLKHVV